MKQLSYLFLFFFCLSANILAQSQATLQGKVTEPKSGDDAINAYVKLSKSGIVKATVATDFEGNYSVSVDPGTYDVEFSYVGMKTQLFKNVVLNAGIVTKLDMKLEAEIQNMGEIVDTNPCFKYPLTKQDNTASCGTLTTEQLKTPPIRNLKALTGLTAGITATLQGKVTEAKSGDDAINAYVKLSKNGVTKTTVATDFEGNYAIHVQPGTYDVEFSYVGMKIQLFKGVVLNAGIVTKLDVKLEENLSSDYDGCGRDYKIPLIQMDNMSSGATYSAEQIMRSPVRNWLW